MLTAVLVAANVAAFVFELSQDGALEAFVRRWGLVPADVLGSGGPAVLVTVVSSTFLHVSWLLLGSNLVYLGVFGLPVERRVGAARFGLLYLASGLAGSVAY